jgi:xanthine/CO dehydrogenase XdhC/CoxF family maturation factor
MDNINLFRQAAATLDAGRRVALVTVISTTGSTPGKVGYKMLVFKYCIALRATGCLMACRMVEMEYCSLLGHTIR